MYVAGEIVWVPGRDLAPSLRSYVIDSWLRSYWHGSAMRCVCSFPTFSELYSPTVAALIREGQVGVARMGGDVEECAAWACTGPHAAVHYVYVREPLRRMGLARALLCQVTPLRVDYTHETLIVRRHVACKVPRWRYAPERLLGYLS